MDLSSVQFVYALTVKTLVMPVSGIWGGRYVAQGLLSLEALPAGLAAVGLASVVAWFLAFLTSRFDRLWRWTFLASYVGVTAVIVVSAWSTSSGLIWPGDGERYFHLPRVVLLTLVLQNVSWTRRGVLRRRSLALTVALLACLIVGAVSFRRHTFARPDWPSWRAQVGEWERGKRELLYIWPPGSRWAFTLPRR
jgi:hypothetical protein